MGKPFAKGASTFATPFTDDSSIADWAIEAVYQVRVAGINIVKNN